MGLHFEGYNMTDRILEKYPEAKFTSGCTPGYAYDFGKFQVIKNITGTLGWIGIIYDPYRHVDGHTAEDTIEKCKEVIAGVAQR
jgi:hypothetical protein